MQTEIDEFLDQIPDMAPNKVQIAMKEIKENIEDEETAKRRMLRAVAIESHRSFMEDFVGVQPMLEPAGHVLRLRTVYSN